MEQVAVAEPSRSRRKSVPVSARRNLLPLPASISSPVLSSLSEPLSLLFSEQQRVDPLISSVEQRAPRTATGLHLWIRKARCSPSRPHLPRPVPPAMEAPRLQLRPFG